jgi:hypothetical protein
MTANKQYFANYKSFSASINISLADKGSILVYGSGRVNVEMLVQGRWCPDYRLDVR